MQLSHLLALAPLLSAITAMPSSHHKTELVPLEAHYGLCYRALFPPDFECQNGWVNVPIMDGQFSTCCDPNSKYDDDDEGLKHKNVDIKPFEVHYGLCYRALFPPNFECQNGWVNVPIMDGQFSTCCDPNSKYDDGDELKHKNVKIKPLKTQYGLCYRALFPPNFECPNGWVNVPIMDGQFSTCCDPNSEYDDGDETLELKRRSNVEVSVIVEQDPKQPFHLSDDLPYPECSDKCPEDACTDICDIKTHKCYNACIE